MKTKLPILLAMFLGMFALAQNAGDVIVTELMFDPDGDERAREWFEVYNTTGTDINMNGWTIFDESSSGRAHVITSANPVIVPANSYAVLVSNADPLVNGGMTAVANNIIYEYSYESPVGGPPSPGSGPNSQFPTWNNESTYINGSNNDDGIRLELPNGTVIDQILYGFGYPDGNGGTLNGWPAMGAPTFTSYQLDANTLDAVSNDNAVNWLESTSTYGTDGAVGTPGTANFAGGGTPALAAGDIVITEIMIDPSGNEDEREWFEVYNITASDIDLQDWVIKDVSSGNSKSHLINASTIVPAGGYAILAASSDMTVNGGITNVTYAYGFVSQDPNTSSTANGFLRLNNEGSFNDGDITDDELDGMFLVSPSGLEIDRVAYDFGFSTMPVGFPMPGLPEDSSIESNTFDATANDLATAWAPATATYGTDGQFGTPGVRNTLSVDSPTLGQITLFPNPSNDFISIELENGQWNNLEVYNVTGQQVLKVNSFQERVNVTALQTGTYFVRINAAQGTETIQFLLK